MGVNKNTTVLFREIQEEGQKLLAMGVNPKICCTNREHQNLLRLAPGKLRSDVWIRCIRSEWKPEGHGKSRERRPENHGEKV